MCRPTWLPTLGNAALGLERVPEEVLVGRRSMLEAAVEAAAEAVAEAGLLLCNMVLACREGGRVPVIGVHSMCGGLAGSTLPVWGVRLSAAASKLEFNTLGDATDFLADCSPGHGESSSGTAQGATA